MKKHIVLLNIIGLLLFIGCSASPTETISGISREDVETQIKSVKEEPCSDLENKLYLINDMYLYHVRRGNCPDNGYTYTLFGSGLKELCFKRDSIAGPQIKYTTELKYLFDKLLTGKAENNFGLDSAHKITLVYSK